MRTVETSSAARVGVATVMLAVAGCAPVPAPPSSLVVEQHGAMRAVMREGHTEARVRLGEVVSRPHAYAVGALEGLDGEITIADGAVWVARVEGAGPRVTGPAPVDGDAATLLTVAHVPRWQSARIDAAAEGRELERVIERIARSHDVDTSTAFPFVIEGAAASLELHVINGFCPIAGDPATVDAEPWRWSRTGVGELVIVGFYAPDAAGVMTHHGTSVHAHAIVERNGRTITGHVDRLAVTPGATLYVPAEARTH